MKITPELFDLLTTAQEYSRITHGAFDITYASVGYLYDYRRHVKPSGEQIQAALPGSCGEAYLQLPINQWC